jgi:hypothetical protein
MAFYLHSKGETERALAELGYQDTIFFRPAMLAKVKRSEGRLTESALLYVTTEVRNIMMVLTPQMIQGSHWFSLADDWQPQFTDRGAFF